MQQKRSDHQHTFLQNQVYQLEADNDSLMKKLKNSEENLKKIISRTKEQFLVQKKDEEPEYVSKREWDLMNENRNLLGEIEALKLEKDKYHLQYVESKRLGPEGNTEEQDFEVLNVKYKNNLQISQSKERQLARRLSKFGNRKIN